MYRIGVDLGGINIKFGLVDDACRVVVADSAPTPPDRTLEAVSNTIVASIHHLLDKAKIPMRELRGMGIGSPGAIDSVTGHVVFSNNFDWNDADICGQLQQQLHCPVYIANDAECAVMGEATAGNGVGCKNLVLLTLGTGVGSGILVDGKLLRGNGYGGIAGHMVIAEKGRQCSCGRKGCLERYASATALICEAEAILEKHPESLIGQHLVNQRVTGKTVFDAAQAGDPFAQEVLNQYITFLACGIGNLVNIFRPDKVLLSGGICNQEEALLQPLRSAVAQECFACTRIRIPPIEVATLKNNAGLLGAACLVE